MTKPILPQKIKCWECQADIWFPVGPQKYCKKCKKIVKRRCDREREKRYRRENPTWVKRRQAQRKLQKWYFRHYLKLRIERLEKRLVSSKLLLVSLKKQYNVQNSPQKM